MADTQIDRVIQPSMLCFFALRDGAGRCPRLDSGTKGHCEFFNFFFSGITFCSLPRQLSVTLIL